MVRAHLGHGALFTASAIISPCAAVFHFAEGASFVGFKQAPIQRRLRRAPRALRESVIRGMVQGPSLQSACAADASELRWWNQEAALSRLFELVSTIPTEVLVLTGPVNGGKSRLLKEFAARTKTATRPPAVIYVDCRTSAAAYARELQLQALALTWSARVPPFFSILSPLIELVSVIDTTVTTASRFNLNFSFATRRLLKEVLPLADVLSIYSKAIAQARSIPGAPPPIVIVVRSVTALRYDFMSTRANNHSGDSLVLLHVASTGRSE